MSSSYFLVGPGTVNSSEEASLFNTDISFLKRGYQILLQEAVQNEHQFTVLEDQLLQRATENKHRFSAIEEKLKMLTQMLSTQVVDTSATPVGSVHPSSLTPFHHVDTSEQHSVVQNPLFDNQWGLPVQQEHQESSRVGQLKLATRETMLKKVETPICDGSNIHDWLVDIDQFLTMGGFRDVARLDLVALCLVGRVKEWFAWVFQRDGFRNWQDFKQQLIVRFAESIDEAPSSNRQSDSVSDSSKHSMKLEDAFSQVAGVDNVKQRGEAAYTTLPDVAGLLQLRSPVEDVCPSGVISRAAEFATVRQPLVMLTDKLETLGVSTQDSKYTAEEVPPDLGKSFATDGLKTLSRYIGSDKYTTPDMTDLQVLPQVVRTRNEFRASENFFQWVVTSQVAEDINSSDEILWDTVLSPLVPLTPIHLGFDKFVFDGGGLVRKCTKKRGKVTAKQRRRLTSNTRLKGKGIDKVGGVRVPLAYCGLLWRFWDSGIGIIPVFPSFDAGGSFALVPQTLRCAGHVIMQFPFATPRNPMQLVLAADYLQVLHIPVEWIPQMVIKSAEKLFGRQGLRREHLENYFEAGFLSLNEFRRGEANGDAEYTTARLLANVTQILQKYEFLQPYNEWISIGKPSITLAIYLAEEIETLIACWNHMLVAIGSLLKAAVIMVIPTMPPILPPHGRTTIMSFSGMCSKDFKQHFPTSKHEGKLGFVGGSVDRFHQVEVAVKVVAEKRESSKGIG